jgi:hypothetical protein
MKGVTGDIWLKRVHQIEGNGFFETKLMNNMLDSKVRHGVLERLR